MNNSRKQNTLYDTIVDLILPLIKVKDRDEFLRLARLISGKKT